MVGPSSARIAIRWETGTSKHCGRAIWQLSDDPYHTEFVSLHVDQFLFFYFFPYGCVCVVLTSLENFIISFAPFPNTNCSLKSLPCFILSILRAVVEKIQRGQGISILRLKTDNLWHPHGVVENALDLERVEKAGKSLNHGEK